MDDRHHGARLAQLVVRLQYMSVVVLLGLTILGWVARPDVTFTITLADESRFELMAILAGLVIGLLGLAMLTTAGTAEGDPRASRSAQVLEWLGAACGVGGATVGWLCLVPSSPKRLEVGDLLWFMASVAVVFAAGAVVDLLPADLVERSRRSAWESRREWVVRARAHGWRATRNRWVLVVQVVVFAVALSSAAVVSAWLAGLPLHLAITTAWLWPLVAVVAGALIVAYVSRSWIVVAMTACVCLLGSLEALQVALFVGAASDNPIRAVAGWMTVAVLVILPLAADVFGESTHWTRPQVIRALVFRSLTREDLRLAVLLDPPCTCTAEVKTGRLKRWHQRKTGRQ